MIYLIDANFTVLSINRSVYSNTKNLLFKKIKQTQWVSKSFFFLHLTFFYRAHRESDTKVHRYFQSEIPIKPVVFFIGKFIQKNLNGNNVCSQ